MNDETRRPNDERVTKHQSRMSCFSAFRNSGFVPLSSFDIRNSSFLYNFVIPHD
jgi:hypothetical protein